MFLNQILVVTVITLCATYDFVLSATNIANSATHDPSTNTIFNNEKPTRVLRCTTIKDEGSIKGEERTITDPVILQNLAKFEDWVTKGKTAEKVYQELGLKSSWKIAYQTSRWQQFLFDEPEYVLFRKYVKYLKLIGRAED
ncbi:Avirulence protein (Avh) [Phytophthora palmivora]|uniref:RxLR effector protein n=1 Tax=Phytophthora palmivora TaxID=4796 RepID=A0A2P4XZN0_9STRA|nr:Avirulence protein (Avh) [Phytophthora palmivora]